jgi:hypothetical protein
MGDGFSDSDAHFEDFSMKRESLSNKDLDLKLAYAAYANHMAIQRKVPMTWHTWKREQTK